MRTPLFPVAILTIVPWLTAAPALAEQPVFSTFLGGSLDDQLRDVAADSQGNVVVTGGSISSDFPTTAGAADRTHNGDYDVIVVKYDPAGSLLWSTFLGGPNYDRAYGVAIDGQDNIYIAGRAGSAFPTTAGVFQPSFAGDANPNSAYGPQDGFVCKLDPGGAVQFCTYFGDDSRSFLRDIDVDAAGNIYIAGGHNDGGYPSAIAGAFLNTPRGGQDAVVARLATDGSSVQWARYAGGSSWESEENSVQLDGSGNPYLLFTTQSGGIATAGAYDTGYAGAEDVFVTRLDASGSLLWGSYIGGSGNESTETHELAVDAGGDVYVAVATTSADNQFPLSASTVLRRYGPGGGSDEIVVAKLSADGTRLEAITFLGGGGSDQSEGVAVHATHGMAFTGKTTSADFPVTADALEPSIQGRDAFLVRLTPDLELSYATFLGGSGNDVGRGAEIDAAGNSYLIGKTPSGDWPTLNPHQSSPSGAIDGFVTRFTGSGGAGAVPDVSNARRTDTKP